MRTWKFFKQQIEYQPKTFTLMIMLCYILACCLLCTLYLFMSWLVSVCWPHLERYSPIKIKRRTICFCRYARRRLVKILLSIYGSQCNWQPQHFNILDETTRKCIVVIKNTSVVRLGCEELEITLVGSSAEGLGRPYVLDLKETNRDPMWRFLLRFFCCCLPCNTSYSSLRTDINVIMECKGYRKFKLGNDHRSLFVIKEQVEHPGFVNIIANPNTESCLTTPWKQFCKKEFVGTYLSSELIRKAMLDSINSVNEHNLPASRIFGPLKHPPYIELETKGPAVKLTLCPPGQVWYWNENQKFITFEGDFVFGIHCHQQWPKCAQKWFTRPRHWPLQASVQHVAESGFILVAKPFMSSAGNGDDLEWMISFPHCETYLSSFIPQRAKACYLALKIIFKAHLSYYCKNLKTYHLKTLLFWELEKHPAAFWEVQNIEQCFLCLLDRLIEVIGKGVCPNYWIENLNLFQKCDRNELVDVSCALQKIRSDPAPYIDDIGSMWC